MVDSGISSFAEPRSSRDNPELLIVDVFPDMNCVFAHGCRAWWYHSAAIFGPTKHNVKLRFSVLPPQKLPEYYSRFEPTRLAGKWVFGTDRPVVSAIHRNADALAKLGLHDRVLCNIYAGNAAKVVAGLDN